MQTVWRWMRWLDYATAVASLGWGLWQGLAVGWLSGPWPMVATFSGIAGLGLARWNLSLRLQGALQRRFASRPLPSLARTADFPLPPSGVYSPPSKRAS